MKRAIRLAILSMAALSLAGLPAARAQNAPAMPTVDQILEKYVTALGGKAALEKINSRVARGTFEIPENGVTGTMEQFAKAPNKSGFVVDIDGFGQVRQGFNGTSGWQDNPQQGMRDFTADETANAKRTGDLQGALHFKQHYPKVTLAGKQKSGDRDAYLLEADPGDGNVRKMYFDAETGFLVKVIGSVEGPQGKTEITAVFEDFKEAGGVKWAYTTRQQTAFGSRVIRFTDIQVNVPVDDAKFEKPKN